MALRDARWLFFDVGYTLVDEDASWARRFELQAATAEAREKGVTREALYDGVVTATLEHKPQYLTAMKLCGLTGERIPYPAELDRSYADALPALKTLATRYRLGIIANQDEGIEERLAAWGMGGLFTAIASSSELGVEKPDERLFLAGLERAGCRAEEAVMIGDRLDNDVLPAKRLGMGTVWMRHGFGAMQSPSREELVPDAQVDSMTELVEMMEMAL